MKNKKLLLIGLTIIVGSIVIFQACKKENALLNSTHNIIGGREEWDGIRTSHDMLVFTDRDAFNKTLKLLMQDDNTNIDTTTVYDPTESIIYNKVLDNFERKFSFVSLRKDIENKEIPFLQGGMVGDDPRSHFICDEYLRTVLNPEMEVQIGDTIFRYVNKLRIICITDGDYGTLAEIRKHPLDYYQFTNVTESTLSGKISWRRVENTESCNAYFTYTEHPNSGFIFSNHSVSSDGYAISGCLWDFGDGTTSTAINPPIHYFTGASTHTVYLSVTFFDGCTAYYNLTIYDCYASFNETHVGAEYSFIAVNPGSLWYYAYSWNFGDGTGISGFQGFNHIYTSAGTFHVCVTVTNTITQCVSTYCQDVIVTMPAPTNCVYTAETTGSHVYGSSNNYKMDGRVWIRNDIIENRIGVETWNYKWKNGQWSDQKDYIKDGFYGQFWADGCSNPHTVLNDSNAPRDSHNGQKKSHLYQTWTNASVGISTSKIGIQYHTLNSVHWLDSEQWNLELTLAQ